MYCVVAKLHFLVSEVMAVCYKPLPQLEEVEVVAPFIRSVQEIQQGASEV